MKSSTFLLILLVLISRSPAQEPALPPDRHGVPMWKFDPQFAGDSFTFLRLLPDYHPHSLVDFPDSDLNFPYRLHQLTSLNVNPVPRAFRITSPELRSFPFAYIVEGGSLQLTDEEARILRDYCLGGGFLMFDDFWGGAQWQNVSAQVGKIFPGRKIVELTLEHPIFHTVFDMTELPQIPAIEHALRGRDTGIFWERPDAQGAHFYGVFDDQKRMMILICRDTDLGDGWEREGADPWYFETFSKPKAYPLGVNIVVYALTH